LRPRVILPKQPEVTMEQIRQLNDGRLQVKDIVGTPANIRWTQQMPADHGYLNLRSNVLATHAEVEEEEKLDANGKPVLPPKQMSQSPQLHSRSDIEEQQLLSSLFEKALAANRDRKQMIQLLEQLADSPDQSAPSRASKKPKASKTLAKQLQQ